MHPDDLNTVWLCTDCGRKFVFHSDVDEHRKQFNHSRMMLCDLVGGKTGSMFTRGRISIAFRFNGHPSRVLIDYEYHPSSGTIRYVDVRYTDNKLKSRVEDNPEMMKNIDDYLRKRLKSTQNESGVTA